MSDDQMSRLSRYYVLLAYITAAVIAVVIWAVLFVALKTLT